MTFLLLVCFFDSFLFPRGNLWERQFNPAHLNDRRLEIVLASEMRFELSELRTYELYSQIDRYAVRAASFGSDIYRENFFEFGFGFPAGRYFGFGIAVAGLNTWIENILNEFSYTLKAGGRFESDQFLISAWVNNINVPRLSSVDYIPVSYSVRFGYKTTEFLHFNFTVLGIEMELPFYNFGLVFSPYHTFLVALSVNTKPILLEYGAQLSVGRMFIRYSGNRHQQLGLSHNIGVGFTQ